MTAFQRLLLGIRAAFYWNEAREAASKGFYKNAVQALQKVFGLYGADGPSLLALPQFNLLYGLCSIKLDQPDAAFVATQMAVKQLRGPGRIGSRLSQDERLYLMLFARNILLNHRIRGVSEAKFLADQIVGDLSDVDFRKVHRTHRSNFPISIATDG